MAKYPGVSPSVTRRLPRYYRFLEMLCEKGVERISSREFAEIIGLTASQIRQDLNCFGGFGQQGYGYNVAALHSEIGRILHLDRQIPSILLGVGNIGVALIRNMHFEKRGFKLIAAFDSSPDIIGRDVGGHTILDVALLNQFCSKHNPRAAILCIPEQAAADTAKQLVDCGIRGFWNFSHYDLALEHNGIAVENVHLSDSLMTLSFYISELSAGE